LSSQADAIKLSCACGKRIAVPAAFAGKRVRCPKCRAALHVPQADTVAPPPEEDDGYILKLAGGDAVKRPQSPVREELAALASIAGTKTCPACQQSLPASARICVPCGIDLKTGRAIEMRDDEHLDSAYTYAEGIVRIISWVIFCGIYPVASEAFGLRKPWTVRGIAALTSLVSIYFFVHFVYTTEPDLEYFRWMDWSGKGFRDEETEAMLGPYSESYWYQGITSALLHDGVMHLVGNLLFLFVLGSRVNMLIGNVLTVLAYPLLAIGASLIQSIAQAEMPRTPALGASGAIMGLAGMYLVLFPATKVHMVAWWRWGLVNLFQLSMNIFPVRGFWVVAFYIALDVLFTALGAEDGVAHWAHLGGFLVGVGLALVLLVARVVDARGGDLLSLLAGQSAWLILGKPSARRLSLW
jgi:membrane associated rhomboid family serine protease